MVTQFSSMPLQPAEGRADLVALADRHRATVYRYLRVLGADAALADDLAQEAFVVVLRRADFDAREPIAALHFLRATARHLYLQSRRRRTSEREVEAADAVWDERCGEDGGAGRLAALRRCVEALPQRSRALLDATYAEAQGRAAAGRALGLWPDGVKSALRRLRAGLLACIERRLDEDHA